MGWYLILATIPVGVFGLIFSHQIETGARNLWLIASALIVLALVLLVAERRGTQTRTEEQITTKDALVVGVAQSLALIPGVSRSGATITAGLFQGLDRVTAARFSFLMSVPAVVASGAVRGSQDRRGRRTRHGGDRGGHGDLLRRRPGLDRLAAEVRLPALHHVVHRLPGRARACC